jgi:hypothetical protein
LWAMWDLLDTFVDAIWNQSLSFCPDVRWRFRFEKFSPEI